MVLTFFFLNSQYSRNTKPSGSRLGMMESKMPWMETLPETTRVSGKAKET